MAKIKKLNAAQLSPFCDHYGVRLDTLEYIAVRYFAQLLKDHPQILFGAGKIILEPTGPLAEPEKDPDDWWKKCRN